MSNPAVITLAQTEIGGESFRIEDNIGESIHIHIHDFRIELTIDEFLLISRNLIGIAEKMINVKGFKFDYYDAIWLSQAGDLLINVKEIRIEERNVLNLRTNRIRNDGSEYLIGITESRVIQSLNGDDSEILRWKQTNYIGETNSSRLESIYSSIQTNGYNPPKTGSYVVICDGSSFVFDGCHRASCIYKLNGGITILVSNWITKNGTYSDEHIIEGHKFKERELRHLKHLKDNRKQFRRELVKYLSKRDLSNKKVIIKGGGRHTVEFLNLINEEKIEIHIVAIIGDYIDEKLREYNHILDDDLEIRKYDADILLISSYRHRYEMLEDIARYKGRYETYDFYTEGVDYEFFS